MGMIDTLWNIVGMVVVIMMTGCICYSFIEAVKAYRKF